MKIFILYIYDKEGFWEMLNDFLKIKEHAEELFPSAGHRFS